MKLALALALAAHGWASNRSGKDAPVTGIPVVSLPSVSLGQTAGLGSNLAPVNTVPNLSAGVVPNGSATIPELPASKLEAANVPLQPSASANGDAVTPSPLVPAAQTAQTAVDPKSLEPEKAPSTAPKGWKQTMGRLLSSIVNPFGGGKKEEPAPKSESERLDREFAKADVWGQVAGSAKSEIEALRAKNLDKKAVRAYVAGEADAAMKRILEKSGSKNLGFHYNLHGGVREDYVGSGIRATMGDIALNYTMNGDRNFKVYFFQSKEHSLFNLLDESNPQIMLFPSRMGSVLNVFRLDDPQIEAAKADGRIKNHGSISMDFHGMKGVPYSAYVAPPMQVFVDVKKKLGLKKLSRDEETLAVVRYLEAALAAGPAYIPKS